MRGVLVVAVLVLAGCSSAPVEPTGSSSGADFSGLDNGVSETTGAIHGVVVDPAIVPVAGVTVLAHGASFNRSLQSDALGRFVFTGLTPGTYFLVLTHLLYHKAQTSVEVKAGVEPQVTRIALDPVFTQKPFHDQHKFTGYLFCGYSAGLTSPCVFDYTQLACGGGCDPTLHDILIHAQGDTRYFITAVGPNWQTEITELSFDPPQAGISKSMTMSYSYFKRTSTEYMGSVNGASPLLLRLELGVDGPGAAGPRHQINASGNDDLYIFLNVHADSGGFVGLAVQQKFEVVETTFYNAKPPADWSFVKGDKFPF